MLPKLLILGGGGHASDVLAVAEDNGMPFAITIADDCEIDATRFESREAVIRLGIASTLTGFDGRFVSGVGYPATRMELVHLAIDAGIASAAPLIHRLANVQHQVPVGVGSVVSGFAWLSALSSLGDHVYVGYGAKVGHDAAIGDYSSLMPGAFVAGEVQIGAGVMVGANATILEGRSIGDLVRIGAGSVITKDVPDGATVTGIH